MRMLEICYNFSDKKIDIHKLEEFQMDTDSLKLALTENDLTDCVRPEKQIKW